MGLAKAPRVLSATANPDGTVTVVILLATSPAHPNLTVVMSEVHGRWLATDFRTGSGSHPLHPHHALELLTRRPRNLRFARSP